MISIRNLTHTYPGSRSQRPRNALIDVTLEVREGEFCILSGPNGSGKSSLFRILCGLTLPTAGAVSIAGIDLLADPAPARELMGVVFQNPAIDKHLSAMENLRLHGSLYRIRGAELARRIEEAVSWTAMAERLGDKVDTLSGGLQRQVELAKVLLTRPRVLLLDEPTTGLDPASRVAFLGALRRLQKERGMTVLMTTHIFSEAEDADRVAILKDGRLLAFAAPQVLRAAVGREIVVVQATDPAGLEARLTRDFGLTVRRYGDELRLEEGDNGEALPLLERILGTYRPEILSISIKRPALDDVFIHITGNDAGSAPEEMLRRTGT